MDSKIIQLGRENLDEIMNIEEKAFIPSIKTIRKNIENRLKKGHMYFGAKLGNRLVGTLAMRYAYFKPDIEYITQ